MADCLSILYCIQIEGDCRGVGGQPDWIAAYGILSVKTGDRACELSTTQILYLFRPFVRKTVNDSSSRQGKKTNAISKIPKYTSYRPFKVGFDFIALKKPRLLRFFMTFSVLKKITLIFMKKKPTVTHTHTRAEQAQCSLLELKIQA